MKVEKIFKTFEWFIYLALYLGSGFFILNVWNAFQSRETSIKHYSKQWETMIPPKVTFCFVPLIKTSVLDKYNLTLSDVMGRKNLEINSTFLEEGYYQLGRDFDIETMEPSVQTDFEQQIHNIEEVYTFHNGKCFKINLKAKIKEMEYYVIKITPSKQLLDSDIPKVNFYVTSEDNAYDIITDQWVSGKQPIQFEIDLKEVVSYDLNLQMFEYKKLDSVSNCSHDSNPIICGAKK